MEIRAYNEGVAYRFVTPFKDDFTVYHESSTYSFNEKCDFIFQRDKDPGSSCEESYVTETGERIRAIRYTADFSYRFGGKLVVEDVKTKPTRTKEYLRNRKFMRSKFGIEIQEV